MALSRPQRSSQGPFGGTLRALLQENFVRRIPVMTWAELLQENFESS